MIKPHGNKLVGRVLNEKEKEKILANIDKYEKIVVDDDMIFDIKNIARGAYSPLEGFLSKDGFESVVEKMRLSNGLLWSIPIILDIDEKKRKKLEVGQGILLTDNNDKPIARMLIKDIYGYDKARFADKVFKTEDEAHPGVMHLKNQKDILIGGEIDLIDTSKEPFNKYHLEPKETRYLFKEKGWNTVVAFQTRNAPHMAHEYLQRCALEMVDGLFINPVIGKKKKGDFRDDVILTAYEALIKNYYPRERVVMSILPMRMKYAGPREAIFHAIVRKNFGCTHFIVGRDHAGVGKYYGTYDAQEIFETIEHMGIHIMKFDHSFFCKRCQAFATIRTCRHEPSLRVNPSGTRIREMIRSGKMEEEHLIRPEVLNAIKESENPYV